MMLPFSSVPPPPKYRGRSNYRDFQKQPDELINPKGQGYNIAWGFKVFLSYIWAVPFLLFAALAALLVITWPLVPPLLYLAAKPLKDLMAERINVHTEWEFRDHPLAESEDEYPWIL